MMNRRLLINFLVFTFCSSVYTQKLVDYSIYSFTYKANCARSFQYEDNQYTDCTTDGNNGNIPWCSMTGDYQGLITYCADFRNTSLQCVFPFKMPNGKTYTSCDYLSTTSVYKQCQTNHPKIKYRYCTDALSSTGPLPPMRLTNCDPAYQSLSPNHTMCYRASPYAIVVPLTAVEQQGLLDIHNQYRAAVPSRYMFKLYWNNDLATLAQAHSNLCVFEHDIAPNRVIPKFGWWHGQNLAMSTEIRSTPASLIDMMLSSEKAIFQYGVECSGDDPICDFAHYTQAMLSNITHVGCGQTHCVYPDRIERYLTCNYMLSQYDDTYYTPYVPSSTPAVDCPSNNSSGLCDCGDKICRYDNGEYLEPASCKCKKSPHSVGKREIKTIKIGTIKRSIITKRNANGEELERHQNNEVKLQAENTGSRLMDKRETKKIKIKKPHKRNLLSKFQV